MAIMFGDKTAEEALVTCDEFNQEAQNESQQDATDRADNSKANTSVEAATVH